MRPLYCQSLQGNSHPHSDFAKKKKKCFTALFIPVCRPRVGSARQVGHVSLASFQGILCLSSRKLCKGKLKDKLEMSLIHVSASLVSFNIFQDLSRLGRDLDKVIIIDNSPASYIFHPDNAVSQLLIADLAALRCASLTNHCNNSDSLTVLQVPVTSWFDDMGDVELLELLPFFESIASVDSVYSVLRNANSPVNHNHNLIYAQSDSDIHISAVTPSEEADEEEEDDAEDEHEEGGSQILQNQT